MDFFQGSNPFLPSLFFLKFTFLTVGTAELGYPWVGVHGWHSRIGLPLGRGTRLA